MGNIAYIVDQPPTHRDLERFFVLGLINEGFNVLVFDLTGCLHPEFDDDYGSERSSDASIKPFVDIQSFEKSFAMFNPEWTFFLINHGLNKNFFRIFYTTYCKKAQQTNWLAWTRGTICIYVFSSKTPVLYR